MTLQEINKLKELDFTKQAAFAYITCERLFHNYLYFSNNFNFGSPGVLREAIDYIQANIFEKNIDKNRTIVISKKVDKNTPDTADFSTILVSSALDACTVVFESLEFLIDKQFSRIQDIIATAIDTVHMYIMVTDNLKYSDKDFQQRIDNHPLMQQELKIQSGIVAFLSKRKNIDPEDIQTLLDIQDSNNKSNIGL